jgi:L-threonylcarbamoyladenylate synthase
LKSKKDDFYVKTRLLHLSDPHVLELSIASLKNGDLIAFPTDTVYGLACEAFNSTAIEKIYEVKGRNALKALPVFIGSMPQLDLVSCNPGLQATRLAEKFWPGALTLVVARSPQLPANLSPTATVGVRMPDHPFVLAILQACGPLAATSANLSGQGNPLSARDVMQHLGGSIPLIIDGGPSSADVPSTVVDCTLSEIKVLRQGAISQAALEKALV